jgi:4-hydroxy-tetrahydrodipicolinate synthase
VTELYDAVSSGDLKRAQRIQGTINSLKEVVYASDEPSGDAHARMKAAMVAAGRFKSVRTRPPIEPPTGEALERIRRAVERAELAPAGNLAATPA